MASTKAFDALFGSILPAHFEDDHEDACEDGCRDQASAALTEAARARKRARSIQHFADQSDSEEDEQDRLPCFEAVPESADDDVAASEQLVACGGTSSQPWCDVEAGLAVPATPMPVLALQPGGYALTPSFAVARRPGCAPSRPGHPSQVQTSCPYIAVCENANSNFRPYMEDRASHIVMDGVLYVGCYDGHGGSDASCFLQAHLLRNIHARLHPGVDVHGALQQSFLETNDALRQTGSSHGSTATTIVVNQSRLICANVGDSPAFVLMKNGEVFSLTHEHKIEGAELQRVSAYGVPIYRNPIGPTYMGTSDGTRWLNMSRAFGDFVYPAISCEPHVCTLDVADAKYLVLGSDGMTEKWPIAHVASYVSQLSREGRSLKDVARFTVERAIVRGSTDNITAVVVDLEAYMQHAAKLQAQPQPASLAAPASDAEHLTAAVVAALSGGADGCDQRNNSDDSDDTGEDLL